MIHNIEVPTRYTSSLGNALEIYLKCLGYLDG